MKIPGLTAESSLYRTTEQYRSQSIGRDRHGDNKVIPQISWYQAEDLRNWIGFGSVQCYCTNWEPCISADPAGQDCCTSNDCYWWPFE
jgi:hypothetical protein